MIRGLVLDTEQKRNGGWRGGAAHAARGTRYWSCCAAIGQGLFSTEEIYRQVWNDDIVSDNAIAGTCAGIREKIEINPKEPRYLKVVWGVGYKIERSE